MELPNQEQIRIRCESIPLFPLPQVVFFPNTLLRLHVFEPRYVQLLQDCMKKDRMMAIPRLRPMVGDDTGLPPLYEVAGMGFIIHCKELPDDRYDIVLLGLGRIRIQTEQQSERLYRVAQAELLDDVLPQEQVWERKQRDIKMMLSQVIMCNSDLSGIFKPLLEKDTSIFQFVNTLAHLLHRDADIRQKYIEEDGIMSKLQMVEDAVTTILLSGQIIAE